MDLRQLRYFLRIADDGGFNRAAESLHIAQSALSRHVRELEAELGVALFERHARGADLTESGAFLYRRAKRLLEEVEQTRAELLAQAEIPTGDAAIGSSSAVGRLFYGRLAQRAARDLPRVSLRLVEDVPYALLEALDTGRIDLAVMVNPEPRESLVLEPLITEQVYLVAAGAEAPLPAAPCRVADLRGLPLVTFARPSGSRIGLDAAAARAGIALNIRYEVASTDVMKDFVARGLGYALLPCSSAFAEIEAGTFRAVEVRGHSVTRTLVRRADRPQGRAVAALAGIVRDAFAAMAREGAIGTDLAAMAARRRAGRGD